MVNLQEKLIHELEWLETKMTSAAEGQMDIIKTLNPAQQVSARNLIHYLALRSEDIRDLQDRLHEAGLSSLASSESHILSQLRTILERLRHAPVRTDVSECDFKTARRLSKEHTEALFGADGEMKMPRIMVTLDASFASDYRMIKKVLKAGMNVARINCAHDDKATWKKMIALVRRASDKTGLPCKIYMDLAGPKIRTRIRGKGQAKGRIKLPTGSRFLLIEKDAKVAYDKKAIGCSEPGIVHQIKVGDRILFDDGLIEAVVTATASDHAALTVLRNSSKKFRLREGKGMNFPDTDLFVSSLTKFDRSVLPFICEHADLVGYSFVRQPDDVAELQELLSLFPKAPALILKVETPQAVKHFPSLLIQGMKDRVFGVMIARGDLAVEIGFERMSEIQEEIMWISESAHVPVIWATQVLETLNKSGVATRSEITDASYAAMTECVMINKGDYVIHVIRTLRDVLRRTGTHHVKKRYTFRPMQIAIRYFASKMKTSSMIRTN